MVRVISVHHFASQHIQTVEQPTASAVAPPHRLLLALSSHCIEVRDLNDHAEVLFTFPTVDEVTQIVHCLNGDYIATVETKYNRQNKETNFVRVYVNWDNVATMQQSKMTSSGVSLGFSECGMVQPMRARIAGRVTPTTNQSELGSLEMIEIPVKRNPHRIQCCQVSGNIIIQANKIISIYIFEVKIHDISKLKFIDFEEMPICIEISFFPSDVATCENYIACYNHDTLHLFKVVMSNSKEGNIGDNDCEYNFNYHEDVPIDYKKLLRNEALNIGKENVTVHLPTIVKENSIIHKFCPFTLCDKDINAYIKNASPIENRAPKYEIQNLIQLKLKPIIIECAQKQVTEEFKCMLLKPLYIDQNLNRRTGNVDCNKTLKSNYRNLLHSVVCIIATQQEGYLYQFCDVDGAGTVDNCICIYPFTAPVHKIVMEDYFLHALTETGLESYTLRTGHELCRNLEMVDDFNVACPQVNESVCLVGLRPFLGIEEILLDNNYLVLLANGDSSPTHSVSSSGSSTASYWTLYNLELPTPKTVFNDISIVANVHRFTSTQTYCHLMNEAHMILRISLILNKWCIMDSSVTLIAQKKTSNEDLIEAYRTSCALLGDHFVMCANEDDYLMCVPYYKMSLMYPLEVLQRVKKVQEQSNNHNTKGLLHYLKIVLVDVKYGPDADKYFNVGSRQHFSENVVELFEKYSFEDLPNLVLKSSILREYSSDKLINILNNGICRNPSKQNEKLLALVILYIQRCNMKRAQDLLVDINRDDLNEILSQNWELLFESTACSSKHKISTTFSELTIVLMLIHPTLLSEIFATLVTEKKEITLSKLLKVFLEYLPSSIGSDGTAGSQVLQATLELYFMSFFSKHDNIELSKISLDRATHEALKLLVRSYLSQLQILQMKEKNNPVEETDRNMNEDDENFEQNEDAKEDRNPYFEDKNTKNQKVNYLFSNYRCEYLDKMPPFQIEITSKLYQTCMENNVAREVFQPNPEADTVLKKLQALLCCPVISKQVIMEVSTFLSLNENLRGSMSLQSIITNVNDDITVIIDSCPQCLLQFGKDRFTKNDEWKFLIATIQSRIIRLSQNTSLKKVCFFYKKILKDVLTQLATTMNLDQLLEVFPQKMNDSSTFDAENCVGNKNTGSVDENVGSIPHENHNPDKFHSIRSCDDKNTFLKDESSELLEINILKEIQNYELYITMCKETMHANQIKKLITATGQQLLCTLNL